MVELHLSSKKIIVELHLGKKQGSGRTTFVQNKELKFKVTMDVHVYYYNNIWRFKKRIKNYIYIITTKIIKIR